jgi:ATP-dependent helicase/nuclease subunit A
MKKPIKPHLLYSPTITSSDLQKHVFIDAGAGSGKTTSLVTHLLSVLANQPHINLSHILAITFTNKAAQEIITRLQAQIVANQQFSTLRKTALISGLLISKIGTIHSFCASILQKYATFPSASISTSILEKSSNLFLFETSALKTIHHLQKLSSPPLANYLSAYPLSRLISDLKTLFQHRDLSLPYTSYYQNIACFTDLPFSTENTPDLTTSESTFTLLKSLCQIFLTCLHTYSEQKQSLEKLDYLDLLLHTKKLLIKKPQILINLQKKFKYILVDEFQDLDPLQFEILSLLANLNCLAKAKSPLFFIGDFNQSIYSFRGSDTSLFSKTKNLFQENTAVSLVLNNHHNYRNQKNILAFINPFFSTLFTKHPFQQLIPCAASSPSSVNFALLDIDSPSPIQQQAEFLSKWLPSIATRYRLPYHDFAILVRRNKHISLIQQILTKHQLPCYCASAPYSFQAEEIYDIYSFLQFLINPNSCSHLFRILVSPLFNLSNDLIYLLSYSFTEQLLINKLQAFSSASIAYLRSLSFSLKDIKKIKYIIALLNDLRAHSAFQPIPDLVLSLIQYTNHRLCQHTYTQHQIANILFVLDQLALGTQNLSSSPLTILKYFQFQFQNPAINPALTPANPKSGINILTIHAAKGLEFPAVVIAECEKQFNLSKSSTLAISTAGLGLSPPISQPKSPNLLRKYVLEEIETAVIEEEKRIFYVCCTRAKAHLLFLASNQTKKNNKTLSYLDFLLAQAQLNPQQQIITFNFNSSPTCYPYYSSISQL